jgi:hypothetical protein
VNYITNSIVNSIILRVVFRGILSFYGFILLIFNCLITIILFFVSIYISIILIKSGKEKNKKGISNLNVLYKMRLNVFVFIINIFIFISGILYIIFIFVYPFPEILSYYFYLIYSPYLYLVPIITMIPIIIFNLDFDLFKFIILFFYKKISKK